MKRIYEKPLIEIEAYELNISIAANCGTVISLGPEAPTKNTCEEFKDAWEVFGVKPGMSPMAGNGQPFYADGKANCDCYYSSGNSGYFTS